VPIDVSETYAADPDAVLAVLTEEVFLREWAAALGARVQEIEVTATGSGPRTTVRLLSPTAGIPPLFARFVGKDVSVLHRQTWTPDGDGGHRADLDVQTEIFGRSARVRGTRRLATAPEGTRSTVTGDAKVDAPLIGRQAEAAVRELVGVVLRREHDVLTRRLAAPA
jgi:hypothetical protein